jgi:uncharacterized protein YcnI
MSSRARLSRRTAAIGVLACAMVVAVAGPALAHVTVQPDTAQAGAADQVFAFRVPNEEDKAGTVKVQVFFPADHPVASVLAAQVPGWTDQIQTTKLTTPIHTDDGDVTEVVSSITWTGGAINPGHYQDFTVDLGQLPTGTDQLVFKALQTYSNGDVVRWIDLQQPGQPEPDHPAPVLHLIPVAATGTATPKTPAATTTATGSGSDNSAALAFGITGTVLGALGLGTAAYTLRRRHTGAEG